MATFYSDQVTKHSQSTPPKMIAANENGKRHTITFTYTTPAASAPAVGDYVELCKVPAGARILGGKLVVEALSSGAGVAGADVGYDGADTRYLAAGNLDAAATVNFGDSIALNYGEVLTAEKTLRAKVTGEAWAVSKKVYGEVSVILP